MIDIWASEVDEDALAIPEQLAVCCTGDSDMLGSLCEPVRAAVLFNLHHETASGLGINVQCRESCWRR